MTTRLESLGDWIDEIARLTHPDRIHWCTGTREEYDEFLRVMLSRGDLLELNQDSYPDCYLHRSDPGTSRAWNTSRTCVRSARRTPGPTTTGCRRLTPGP